jgi:cell division protein FtsB
MFNRSIKYVILVIINIVVITLLVMGDDQKSDVFDTDYVINLLDSSKQLERQVTNLTAQNKFLETSNENVQRQLMQTRDMIDGSVERLRQCRSDQASMVALREQQLLQRSKIVSSQSFSAQVCSDNAVKVSFLNKQMISLKAQLTAANTEARSANTENQIMQSKLEKLNLSIEKFGEEKRLLQEINKQLETDLSSNIYVKQIYTAPTYCQPSRFEELVCVQRLLVRPQFSKTPFTDVQTTLTDPQGKVIGSFSFEATKAKLVDFPFPEDTEQSAGEYTVSFAVDGQTLLEKIILKH